MTRKTTWGEQTVARAKSNLPKIPDTISQQVAGMLDGSLQHSPLTERQRKEIAKELTEKMNLGSEGGANSDED